MPVTNFSYKNNTFSSRTKNKNLIFLSIESVHRMNIHSYYILRLRQYIYHLNLMYYRKVIPGRLLSAFNFSLDTRVKN